MLNYDTDVRENWKSTILDWSKIRASDDGIFFKHRNTLILYVIQLKFRDLNVKIDKWNY